MSDPNYEVNPGLELAAGDIDLDGLPEIVAFHESGRLMVVDHDGAFKWFADENVGGRGAAIADLDSDGIPEIVVRATVFDNTGQVVWQGNTNGTLTSVADINLDGLAEVVTGGTAYRNDGTLLWNTISSGFSAIGNFDQDDFPEIAIVSSGSLYLLEHDGQIKFGPVSVPGGGGGPPTIADVDGDGEPEIGVAGRSRFVVFETDGTVKWTSATQDFSSQSTGSSVFDFEGDGKTELIYGDEIYLRIYDGQTGEVLYQLAKGSGTLLELPIIADVDGDGNAEIVASANDYAFGNKTGIYVIGDANDSWVATRQIWNQHTYHITNVNDDGTIPRVEQPSWLDHNTYRLNAFTDFTGGNPLLAPDLSASFLRSTVVGGDVELTIRIGNGGSAIAPDDTDITFYNGDPNSAGTAVATATTTTDLQPGQFEDVSVSILIEQIGDLWIVVDNDQRVSECDEENNIYHPDVDHSFTNSSPVFESTPITIGREGIEYRYEFNATDPDDDPLSYSLVAAPVEMTLEGQNALVWTPGDDQSGTSRVQLVVEDGRGGSALQFFEILVENTRNAVPEIVSNPDSLIAEVGQPYQYLIEAIDDEDDRLTYSLVLGPDFMRINPDFGTVSWIPLRDHIGQQSIIVRVQDSSGAADVQSFDLQIVEPNLPPVFVSEPGDTAVINTTYVYRVEIYDGNPDDLLELSLEQFHPDMQFDAETGVLTWTPTDEMTDQVVRIRATDDKGATAVQEFTVSAVASAPNAQPLIVSTPRTTTRLGLPYVYVVDVQQSDSDQLSYFLDAAPSGMTIDENGVLMWDNIPANLTSYPITLRVEDGRGGVDAQSFDLQIVSENQNSAPLIVSNPPQFARVDQLLAYDLNADDAEGDFVGWRLVDGPGGAVIDSDTGMLRWIPSLDQVGVREFVIEAMDVFGATSTQSFSIQVTCVNHVPIIDSIPETEATTGRPYFYAVRAIDPEGQPLDIPAGRSSSRYDDRSGYRADPLGT